MGEAGKSRGSQILVKIQIFEKIFKTPLKMFGGDQQPLSDTIHPCINVAPFTNFSADSRGSAKSQWCTPSFIFKPAQGGQPKPTFSTVQTQRLLISASTQSTQTVCVPGSVCVCEKFASVYYTNQNFVYYTN